MSSTPRNRIPSLILSAPIAEVRRGRPSNLSLNFVRRSGLINERRRFAYLQAPKAACSTIVWRLWTAMYEAGDTCSPPERSRIHDADLPIWDGDYAHLNDDRYFRFAIVRNPYARILSAYLNKFQLNPDNANRKRFLSLTGGSDSDSMSFLEFLRRLANPRLIMTDRHWMPLHLVTLFDFVSLQFVGHVESFETDMAIVMKRIFGEAFEPRAIDHRSHRTDAGEQLANYFGPEERDLVQSIYRRDFRLFGYSTDPARVAPVRTVKLEVSGRFRGEHAWLARLAGASRSPGANERRKNSDLTSQERIAND